MNGKWNSIFTKVISNFVFLCFTLFYKSLNDSSFSVLHPLDFSSLHLRKCFLKNEKQKQKKHLFILFS